MKNLPKIVSEPSNAVPAATATSESPVAKAKPAARPRRRSMEPTRQRNRFRLLPLTLIMASLMLSLKVTDIYQNGAKLRDMFRVNSAVAADEAKPEEAPAADTKVEGDTKEAAAKEGDAKEGDKAATEGEKPAEQAADAKEGEKAAEGEKTADGKETQMAKLDDSAADEKDEKKREFSNIELDILQSLTKRREEIEARAQEVDLKEKLLEATELRINDKVTEIKTLKDEVQKLLKEYNALQENKLSGLVKIYENMKPGDAAQIFNELDMQILLEVIDKMSARKVAPVLAGMDPMKAKALTEELAQYRKMRELPKSITQN